MDSTEADDELHRVGTAMYGSGTSARKDLASPKPRVLHFLFSIFSTSIHTEAYDESPLIMPGPGTGIAPFRAFLEEREQRGAIGRTWLFFGDQHEASDFLYRDQTIRTVVAEHGGLDEEGVKQCLSRLVAERRNQRDVY